MRIWLDPAKLNNFQLTPVDVKNAIAAQNVQVSSGQLGSLPAVQGQQLNATIIGKTRLQSAEQFDAILLKVNPDGSQVRVGDVAEVSLGGENYGISAQFNGGLRLICGQARRTRRYAAGQVRGWQRSVSMGQQ